ncbi:MAG: Sir2 silent information regulator family NAD-dependent deacetylase [Oscillospiraceae bacterium]|nr:Sir2 silent information regulator family NAD-dependent deacetylase [Oscillospiraceae bacterium]
MFSKIKTMKYTENYSQKIERLKIELESCDTVIIGAGAGLSAAAGFTYSGERFDRYFSDFKEKYGITDMYSGGFYPYETLEEYWAWWSRQIYYNRYETEPGRLYSDVLSIVKDKDYFVLTTNVDHQFQLTGFDKKRLFYTQGDYGLFQCTDGCQSRTYDNAGLIKQMVLRQTNMKIPTELIPRCPICNKPMTMNLRCDDKFVQDAGWYEASSRYENFLRSRENQHILFFELGVGSNTPVIIKIPFLQMTADNPHAAYACINKGEAYTAMQIENRSICIDEDIAKVVADIKK